MSRTLPPLLVVLALLSSGCVLAIYPPSIERSRGEIVESLQMHYCGQGEWLFELPGKHTVVIANLYGEEFSVQELEQLKLSYEKTFPRVFKNVAWLQSELELKRDPPRTVLIFTADQLETNIDAGEDRWVFATLAMLVGKQLFAVEAAAPLSQQKALERLVRLMDDSVEFEISER